MPRRIALALSLAFTTIVTFALVAMGANAGFFSEATKKATTQKAQASSQPKQDDLAGALQYLAAIGNEPGAASPRTEFYYVYETPEPGGVIYVQRPGSGALQASSATQPGTSRPAGQSASTGNEAARARPTAPPSATAPVTQPTQQTAPAAPITAPSSTPAPPATPAPAQPTQRPASPTPPPAQPTSPPATTTCRDEFVSTVTAIQPFGGGRMITWSNGQQTRLLDGTPHGSSLHVGTRAHVHALQLSAGCTLTEIEGDD